MECQEPGVEGRLLATLVCTLWRCPAVHLAALTLKLLVFKGGADISHEGLVESPLGRLDF